MYLLHPYLVKYIFPTASGKIHISQLHWHLVSRNKRAKWKMKSWDLEINKRKAHSQKGPQWHQRQPYTWTQQELSGYNCPAVLQGVRAEGFRSRAVGCMLHRAWGVLLAGQISSIHPLWQHCQVLLHTSLTPAARVSEKPLLCTTNPDLNI